MKHVVITGANRGIGLELVRQVAAKGHAVTAACRRPDAAEHLLALQESQPEVDVVPLELNDAHSIDRFVHELDGRGIDVLLNNAGIYGQRDATLGKVDAEAWHEAFHVNTIAPLMLTQKLLPHLRKGADRRLAYLSSKMGSIADNTSGGSYVYRSTKAALNQVVRSLSEDLRADGFIALALHPGWVRTDMGGPNGLIDTETSASGLWSVIENATTEQSGHFLNYDGSTIEW